MKKTKENIIDKIAEYYSGVELILLESQLPVHPSSTKNFVAAGAKRSIYGYGDHIYLEEGEKVTQYRKDPWDAIRDFHQQGRGWMFGYVGYDLKNFVEPLTSRNRNLTDTPDFYFMEPEILIRMQKDSVDILSGEVDLKRIRSAQTERPSGQLSRLKSIQTKPEYIDAVGEIQRLIHEGDFYELNYSYPMTGTFTGDPLWLYRKMREINPVPFGSFIRTKSAVVCCASPERFLRKTGKRIISEPIKGTAPRSASTGEDQKYRDELLNEKNRAENLMIVDLVRHDLAQIAKTGTVQVTKLFDVQTFGTVHQLISTVEADVMDSVSPIDVIKTCFPMGSMTGAPKIRVMKSIEDLEIYRRGIYSGAIGYISPDGDFDFNVVIRSAIIGDGKLVYPVGGAITGDSDPEDEWKETHIKARNITQITKQ